jgi:hypothetical protein
MGYRQEMRGKAASETGRADADLLTALVENACQRAPVRTRARAISRLSGQLRAKVNEAAWKLALKLDEQVNARHVEILRTVIREAYRLGAVEGFNRKQPEGQR